MAIHPGQKKERYLGLYGGRRASGIDWPFPAFAHQSKQEAQESEWAFWHGWLTLKRKKGYPS